MADDRMSSPEKNAFNLMKIMRCLQINLVLGEKNREMFIDGHAHVHATYSLS